MNRIFCIIAMIAGLSFARTVHAQDSTSIKRKKGTGIAIGSRGVKITHGGGWSHTNPTWEAHDSYYAMKRIDSNDYVYVIPNLRSYYGVGTDTDIKSIHIVFKDSLWTKQSATLLIQVWKADKAGSKLAVASSHHDNSPISTVPAIVTDSSESVTIHFHPYNKFAGKGMKDYSGTIFIYSGITTDPPTSDNGSDDKSKEEGDFDSHFVIFDLGVNTIADNTDYNSPAVKNFLDVPAGKQNSDLFSLRQAKSINVNIYPFMETFYALKRKNQKINISTGIGLQLYNFCYENPITFTHGPNTVTVSDSTGYKKDKLAFDYLNVPLMFTFKTRLHKDEWLVYGVGITGGYSIATWTKQEAAGRKTKVHDDFGFSNFNSCLTGEIGISTGIRFYGSYQLTNMFDASTGMNQHPITFGIRFFAI